MHRVGCILGKKGKEAVVKACTISLIFSFLSPLLLSC